MPRHPALPCAAAATLYSNRTYEENDERVATTEHKKPLGTRAARYRAPLDPSTVAPVAPSDAKPDYLRVKIWRRMQRLGAVTIKNAAWVLPASDAAMEDFQWLIREIEADGGEALVCEARFLPGLSSAQMTAFARAARQGEAEPP